MKQELNRVSKYNPYPEVPHLKTPTLVQTVSVLNLNVVGVTIAHKFVVIAAAVNILVLWYDKNSRVSLFLELSSIYLPNLDQIGWVRVKCWAEMYFVGSNLVDFGLLTRAYHLGFWEEKKRKNSCVLTTYTTINAQ